MSTKQLKNPRESESAEQESLLGQQSFLGMIKDIPLSEIPQTNVYRHVNTIGKGPWAEGRPGSRRYSNARLPETAFTTDFTTDIYTIDHRFATGDKVKVRSTGTLPDPLEKDTVYYFIYLGATTGQLAETAALAAAGTAINLTDNGTGTHYMRYAANIGAILDHKTEARILKQYGKRVYVSEKKMETWEEVINLESVNPTGVGRMVESGSNAILAAGWIYRIVLDDDFYYMYRLNQPLPTVIITDVNEAVGLTYGYRYYYSLAIISGTGSNRNRINDSENAILVYETGTCINPEAEKQYGEVFFATAIDNTMATEHIIGVMTCPIACQSITHFPLYRTKNIGEDTNGAGNNKAFYIWVDDVPVCKPISITVVGTVATRVAGQDAFTPGDVGCTLMVNQAGTRTGIIASYISGDVVNLAPGHTLGAAESVAIGAGRVMTASQVGYYVLRTAGDVFVRADEGRRVFWGDGGSSVIRTYIDANSFIAATDDTHASQACTIQCNTGTFAFRRCWNDTVMDDGDSEGEIGLNERALAQRDLYIPGYNFRPIPLSDVVITDSGFTVFALRDGNYYWYSHIGAKPYMEGMYRLEEQFGKIISSIRDILVMPGLAIIFCPTKTYNLSLNVPTPNVGNETIGEYIQKLLEPACIDDGIGVIHWQTVRAVNASLLLAITNEPAVRFFDGHSWGKENLAIDPSGLPAVMKDLLRIDGYFGLIAWYSYSGGYKIAAQKWEVL